MTNYILDTTIVEALSKDKPKKVIILCHGYGGDGKDISTLAINWQRFLPDATFFPTKIDSRRESAACSRIFNSSSISF